MSSTGSKPVCFPPAVFSPQTLSPSTFSLLTHLGVTLVTEGCHQLAPLTSKVLKKKEGNPPSRLKPTLMVFIRVSWGPRGLKIWCRHCSGMAVPLAWERPRATDGANTLIIIIVFTKKNCMSSKRRGASVIKCLLVLFFRSLASALSKSRSSQLRLVGTTDPLTGGLGGSDK